MLVTSSRATCSDIVEAIKKNPNAVPAKVIAKEKECIDATRVWCLDMKIHMKASEVLKKNPAQKAAHANSP